MHLSKLRILRKNTKKEVCDYVYRRKNKYKRNIQYRYKWRMLDSLISHFLLKLNILKHFHVNLDIRRSSIDFI